jgi:CRP-like cAMP-binding protein
MNNSKSDSNLPIFFKAGSVIYSEGSQSKYLYLVKRGEVRLMKLKGQHLHVVEFCEPGDILNEVTVLTSRPQAASAIAKTDVEIVLVEQKDILTAIKNSPSWIPDIFKTLCERLESTQVIIEEHNLISSEKDQSFILSKDDEKKYIAALAEFNSKS